MRSILVVVRRLRIMGRKGRRRGEGDRGRGREKGREKGRERERVACRFI